MVSPIVLETCLPRRVHQLLTPKWTSMVLYISPFSWLELLFRVD